MRSFSLFFIGVAFAEETCSDGTCSAEEATMLQMQIRQKALQEKTLTQRSIQEPQLWDRYTEARSTCGDFEPTVVSGQMECQEMAVNAGHDFYVYRAPTNSDPSTPGYQHVCQTLASCTLRGQSMPYYVYSKPWDQYTEARSTCGDFEPTVVSGQMECQQMAVDAGHDFYVYRPPTSSNPSAPGYQHVCQTMASCSLRGQSMPYHVYTKLWDRYTEARSTCGDFEPTVVSGQMECQQMAVDAGHDFYVHRPPTSSNPSAPGYQHVCQTMASCTLRGQSMPYYVYSK